MSTPITKTIFADTITSANANVYIGSQGVIFYDKGIPELRLSDGLTPGGIPISSAPGAQGAQGAQGPQGAYGGPQGNQGAIGPQGNQGIIGNQGNQGASGTAELVYYFGGFANSNTAYPTFPLQLYMGASA